MARACADCTLLNRPGSSVCEACGAYLGQNCPPCTDDATGTDDAAGADDAFLVTARRLWDGLSDSTLEGECGVGIAIRGGRIAWLGLLEDVPDWIRAFPVREHHAEVDSTLMPGLIDCHVHIEFSCKHSLHAQPASCTSLTAMQARARHMLRHGITTARDLGGNGGAIALRSAIRLREPSLPGPRLLCAGQPITRPRGHCHQWGGEADCEAAIRRVVRRQLAAPIHADLIKIMATGGVRTPGTTPAEASFTKGEIEACVAEAAAGGRATAAHAHGVAGIGNAARAGVTTIEHCSWVEPGGGWGHDDPEVIRAIARQSIFVCPTIGAQWARNGLEHTMAPALRRMVSAGVRLVYGSDAGAIPGLHHHRLADGLVVMSRCAQLSHAQALRTATSEAAAALGLGDTCGSLCEGLSADVIVAHGNPLVDLEMICAPLLAVVCQGKLVKPCSGTAERSMNPPWTWARGRDERSASLGGFGSSERCACARDPNC